MSKKYYNQNKEPLYVLHFPGTGLDGHEFIIEDNLNRKISVSDELSIISIMNYECEKHSFVKKQLDNNNIPLYNTAIYERQWNNVLKIKHILKSLEQIKTKYCLIIDGRDVVICNNLDNEFIAKYKSLEKPIIFNGTPISHPNMPIEPIQDLIKIKGKQKYLNAGVAIGETKILKIFYSKAYEISQKNPDNHSEQMIIRMARQKNPELAGHDSENSIFRIVHECDTRIQEFDNGYILI